MVTLALGTCTDINFLRGIQKKKDKGKRDDVLHGKMCLFNYKYTKSETHLVGVASETGIRKGVDGGDLLIGDDEIEDSNVLPDPFGMN